MSPEASRRASTSSYILTFDGGSRGNPGPAYGSYRIQRRGAASHLSRRLRFGHGTSNESEYWALLAGLRALMADLEARGVEPRSARLEVRGDSQLVIRQLEGEWKAKDVRMRELRDQALRLLSNFGDVNLVHHDRARSVAIFGH